MTLETASKSYANFREVLDKQSPATVKTYDSCFWSFLDYRDLTNPDSLLEGSQIEKEDAIKSFIKQKSYQMANKTLWALRMFYRANRVALDWKHISDFMPKQPDAPELVYRPYTKAEIATMLKSADKRLAVAILMMAQAGPRIGALPTVKLDDLTFIEQYKLYAIKFYSFSAKDAYWSFVTPQVSKLINDYEGKRKDGFLFVYKDNPRFQVTRDALVSDLYRLLKKAGLRTPGEQSDTQLDHGFRKFFRTQLEVSRINDDAAERLMGHNTKRLKRIYSMPSPLELLEATEYRKAIPNLTIEF